MPTPTDRRTMAKRASTTSVKTTTKAVAGSCDQSPPALIDNGDRSKRLTLEQIVETGLRLTRASGVGSFTMRTLADELGVTPMATYYYVANKAALVELLIDAVMDAVPIPDPSSGTWSERLWQLNRASRKAFAAHPGLADELLSRPPTRAGRRHIDASIAMLREAGFNEADATQAYYTFEAAMFGRGVIERANRAPVSSDRAYRWAFEILVAGFEARIQATSTN
jgi:AcrR family transcriptional regulator